MHPVKGQCSVDQLPWNFYLYFSHSPLIPMVRNSASPLPCHSDCSIVVHAALLHVLPKKLLVLPQLLKITSGQSLTPVSPSHWIWRHVIVCVCPVRFVGGASPAHALGPYLEFGGEGQPSKTSRFPVLCIWSALLLWPTGHLPLFGGYPTSAQLSIRLLFFQLACLISSAFH